MRTRYIGTDDFDHASPLRIGVLMVNLGTPEAATASAVRRYLAEFLWDPRVVEQPRWLWWLILHGVILRIRPARSARAYATVWQERGSPLLLNSQAQADGLAQALEASAPGLFRVALAMRYGKPDVASAIDELSRSGAARLLVLPMYPQYSATTTGAVFDAVADALKRRRWVPDLRFVNGYHDDPGLVQALATSISSFWAEHGRAERLLFSFHGIPRRYFDAGDPYHCQCHKTARLVADALALEPTDWSLSFQSRVGREEWLRPYTDETLEAWGRAGLSSVQVVCPGFAADCLETLEEIAIENRDRFQRAGGGGFNYIPALNAGAEHLAALEQIVSAGCAPWLTWARAEAEQARDAPVPRQTRARALGAAR